MDSVASQAKFFAILIGINAYAARPLKGCVNDVRKIEEYLRATVSPIQIRTLAAIDSAKEIENGLTQDQPMWPTYDNVRSGFQEIMDSANAGDFVYVHFAGHGTRSSADPSDEFSNSCTGDLALALLEDDNSGQERYLRGAELASWLKDMIDKKLTVTLVLDCCFSAAVYRHEDHGVRYIPYNAEVGSKHSNNSRRVSLVTEKITKHRDSSMLPNWLIDPDKYTILVASGPDQEAKELETRDGQHHGLLSFFLLQAWRQCGSIGTKHKFVHHHLCAISQKYGFRQRPILYGNKEQGFFGFRGVGGETLPLVVTRNQTGSLLMQAGHAHGVHAGDEFVILQTGAAQSSHQEMTARFRARVVVVRGLTSDLELLCKGDVSDQAVLSAEYHHRAFFQQFLIEIAAGLPLKDELTNALNSRSFRTAKEPEDCKFQLNVGLNNSAHCEISSTSGSITIDLFDVMREHMGVDAICDTIEHLAKYQMVSLLANKTPTDHFRESFRVHITHSRGESLPEKITKVSSGEICELVVLNRAIHDIYVFAYSMSSDWQIANLLRGTYEVVPPWNKDRGLTGLFKKKLKMTISAANIEKGCSLCEDEIKVIITTRPTSFDLFELPRLGQPQNTKRSVQRNQRNHGANPNEADDWVAFSFPIHISSEATESDHV